MPVKESAHLFGRDHALVGVLTEPADRQRSALPAVLLLNAGIVHRVGPNRLYVTLARRLAVRGMISLRFDFSGIGDSLIRRDHLPFLRSSVDETVQAMDFLHSLRGCSQFTLIGLCSGADAALRVADADPRAAAVVAINARRYGVDNDETFATVQKQAVARHYRRLALSGSYGRRSAVKFLRGHMNWVDIRRAVGSQIPRPALRRPDLGGEFVIRRLLRRGVAVYCVHSEADEGLDHFHVLTGRKVTGLCHENGFRMDVIKGADHTFTMRWSRLALLEKIEAWLDSVKEKTRHDTPRDQDHAA